MNAILPIKPAEAQEDSWTFDWREDPSIVCEEQPALAVYTNPRGQCVLRQERRWDEEDDTVILICCENALAVVRAILVAVGMNDLKLYRECGMGGEDIDWPEEPFARREAADESKPKDSTAAERQRRRRQKLRNMVTRDNRDSIKEVPELRLAAE